MTTAEPFKPRYWIGAENNGHEDDGYCWVLNDDGTVSLFLDGEMLEENTGKTADSMRYTRFVEVTEFSMGRTGGDYQG